MRLIDGDKLLDWLESEIAATSQEEYKSAIKWASYKVSKGLFDIPSNQEEARLRKALENIAFGRVEGDYSDARQYARGALSSIEKGGNSDE